MPTRKQIVWSLVTAAIGILVAFLGAADSVGHPMRWVHVLTLFFSGVAVGVGLGKMAEAIRSPRKAA